MDTIAEFFRMIRLDRHIGVSSSALFRLMSRIEALLLKCQKKYEQRNGGRAQVIAALQGRTAPAYRRAEALL